MGAAFSDEGDETLSLRKLSKDQYARKPSCCSPLSVHRARRARPVMGRPREERVRESERDTTNLEEPFGVARLGRLSARGGKEGGKEGRKEERESESLRAALLREGY